MAIESPVRREEKMEIQSISKRGKAELIAHEGVVLSPYLDVSGTWTIFIGHTAHAGAPNPASMPRGEDRPINEALDTFDRDLVAFERRVRDAFTRPISQPQFDAAVSFDYNTGAIDRATWVQRYNAGNLSSARDAILWWNQPAQVIQRRQEECALFFDGIYTGSGKTAVWHADAQGAVQWAKGRSVDILALLDERGSGRSAYVLRVIIDGQEAAVADLHGNPNVQIVLGAA